jgi:hypothetical protein
MSKLEARRARLGDWRSDRPPDAEVDAAPRSAFAEVVWLFDFGLRRAPRERILIYCGLTGLGALGAGGALALARLRPEVAEGLRGLALFWYIIFGVLRAALATT